MRLDPFINRLNAMLKGNALQNESVTNKPNSIEVLKHSKSYSDLIDIYVNSTKRNTGDYEEKSVNKNLL